MRKNIPQDGDCFQYSKNYLENTYIGKETKSFSKPPRLPLDIWNVCDEIFNNEPTTNNQTEQWCRNFTAEQPGIQTPGKSFLGLRREDTLTIKLLFKELKDKTCTDPKPAQLARILERNIRFELIVNSFDVCNLNYLSQITNNNFFIKSLVLFITVILSSFRINTNIKEIMLY